MDCRNGWFTRLLPGNGIVPKWVIGPNLTFYCNLNISIGLEQLDNNRLYIYIYGQDGCAARESAF